MAHRRGFFAELQHQNQVAAKRQAQQQRAAVREYNQAALAQQRAAAAHRRAVDAAQRANAAEQVRLNKLAAAAFVAECEAEAVQRSAAAAAELQEIDELLSATLRVDDWVDLEGLRQTFRPTKFNPGAIATPSIAPTFARVPDQPQFMSPAPPSGLGARLGGKGRYDTQLAAAQTQYRSAMGSWMQQLNDVCERNGAERQRWRAAELSRIDRLNKARDEHETEGRQQHAEVRRANGALDELIIGIGRKDPQAIEQYVGIVLANSTYPDGFQVDYDHDFIASDRELVVNLIVPNPDSFPAAKSVRYVKAKAEFVTSQLTASEVKRRYNAAVHQATLRTVHEIFEADRRGVVEAISLTVSADAIDPATGRDIRTPLVQLAVNRHTFLELELARVEPTETLKHLSAAVSKNPYGLIPIAGQGVRG